MESMDDEPWESPVGRAAASPPALPGADMNRLAEALVAQASQSGIALTGKDGLLTALTRQVLQTALEAELAAHLGYERGDPAGRNGGNSRNGSSPKTLTTEIGQLTVDVPSDRDGTFEPQIVPKHQRRLAGFDEARHLAIRERDDDRGYHRAPVRGVRHHRLPRPCLDRDREGG